MSAENKTKPFPKFENDEEAERFVDQANLSNYDFSPFRPMHFEFEKKTAQVNIRMPQSMLATLKAKAKARGIPYQRYIREAIEKALQ